MSDPSSRTRTAPVALNLSANTRRTNNPSPLATSTIPTPTTDQFILQSSPQELGSPYSRIAQSPRSQALNSPKPTGDPLTPSKHGEENRTSPLATPTPRAFAQQRAVSGPISTSAISDSPPLPGSHVVPGRIRGELTQPERLALRTSSIDSTMSSNSSAASSIAQQDPLSPQPFEIQQLVTSAGSPEALIRSLLKEKQSAAQQNAQLWRLINKQRDLIKGLNADLAKTAEDRERYQNRCKELTASMKLTPSQQIQHLRRGPPSLSSSPARSEDDLPIQRHSVFTVPRLENRRSRSVGAEGRTTLKELADIGSIPSDSIASSNQTSPSLSSESKLRATPDSEGSDLGLDTRRNTIVQSQPTKPVSTIAAIAPLAIKKSTPTINKLAMPSAPPSTTLPPIPGQTESTSSHASFSGRRSMTAGKVAANSPIIDTISSPLRKGPPAPLNLQQFPGPPKMTLSERPALKKSSGENSDSENGFEIEELPAFERGRKKTREEDDRERDYIMAKQEESRSQSKKEKSSKSRSNGGSNSTTPILATDPNQLSTAKSPAIHAFAPSGSPTIPTSFSPHASLNGMLSARSTSEQSVTLTVPPMSPGLPRSPRPGDRPQNSPTPRAPSEGHILSPPLSMRSAALSPSTPSDIKRSSMQSGAPPTPISMISAKAPTSDTASLSSGAKSPTTASPLIPSQRPSTPPQSSPFMANSQTPPRSEPRSPVKSPIRDLVKGPKLSSLQRVPSDNSSAQSMTTVGIYQGLVSESYPGLLLPPNALPSISIKVTSSRLRPSRHSMLSLKSMEEEPVFTLGVTARSNMRQLWRVEKRIQALPQLDQKLKQACKFNVDLPDRNLFVGHAPSKIDARREALEKYFEDILDTPLNEKAGLILCVFLSEHAIPAEDLDGGMIAGSTVEGQHPVHLGPDGRILKEGFLTKRGKNFGGWKARYFVLDGPILRYYESPGGSLLGQIKLPNAQIGRQSAQSAAAHSPSRSGEENENEFRHAFLILEPKKKDSSTMIKHILCAENDSERDEWVDALFQYVGTSSDSKPKSSRKTLTSLMKKDDSPVSSHSKDELDSLQGMSYESTVPAGPIRSGPPLESMRSPTLAAFPIPTQLQAHMAISGPTGGAVIQDAMAWGNIAPDSPKAASKEKKRGLWGFRDKTDSAPATPLAPSRPVLPPGAKPVFGMPLAEAVEVYPAKDSNINLPSVVYRCLEYLETKAAASEEGIFRLSGSNLTIKALKDRFNHEGDIDLLAEDTYYDVHAIASLLKMYLRELPSSVLGPRELHIQFQSVLDLENKNDKIAAYNALVHRLPPANWTLIRSLSAFLISIVNNSNINKMTIRNVGIVFSPTLNIPSPLFAAFLTDFEKIFTNEPPPVAALSPVVEALEPGQIKSHVFTDSRPPQSRDGSARPKQSRSRTRSRSRDGSVPTQAQYANHGRRSSAESVRSQPSQSSYHYTPPQVQYAPQHDRQGSRERSLGIPRRASDDGLLPPSGIKSKRESFAPGLSATNIMRESKARRRESSMLMPGMGMGMGMDGAQRKSSVPQLRNAVDMLYDEDNIRLPSD